jgi:hypothetical protein
MYANVQRTRGRVRCIGWKSDPQLRTFIALRAWTILALDKVSMPDLRALNPLG